MTSLELTSAITAIANTLACRLTSDEVVLLAAVFTQLGDTLATIATIQSSEENKQNCIDNNNQRLQH